MGNLFGRSKSRAAKESKVSSTDRAILVSLTIYQTLKLI